MKYKGIFLLIVSIMFFGCSGKDKPEIDRTSSDGDKKIIMQTEDVLVNGKSNKAVVYRYENKPDLTKLNPDISLKGPVNGEFVLIDIIGKIKSIERISVYWDGNVLKEKSIINKYTNIKNKRILVDTYFTEGPPNEKIRIIDLNNKKYELLFEDSLKGD